MSSTTTSLPVYTITVGKAGTYTNDSDVDMTAQINSELKAAPVGSAIDLVFEPGDYALSSPILLPSNTNVIGNGATLSILPNASVSFNGTAMIANADAYDVHNTRYDTNSDGTTTTIKYNPTSTVTMTTNSNTAIIDSNITVSGLVFNETGNNLNTSQYSNVNTDSNAFGTWFANATNVVVQDNVYIGGNDGNAFVNVVNGVVAGNTSVGELAAYDNWDGPVDITIENNSAWQYSINEQAVAASVQINSTPTGDVSNPGTASNDAIISNLFSGDTPNKLAATNTWPLPGYSATLVPTYDITQQGNIDSIMNTPEAQGYYIDDTQGSTTQDNLISQVVMPNSATSTGPQAINSVISDLNYGSSQTSEGTVSGNLVAGLYTGSQEASVINSQGPGSSVTDNAILGMNASDSYAFSGTSTSGNIATTTSMPTNSEIAENYLISAVPDLSISNAASISLSGTLSPLLYDASSASIESVTIAAQFGSIISDLSIDGAYTKTLSNRSGVVITGNLAEVNQALSNLVYVADPDGTSDSIEITASNSAGASAVRYIPVVGDDGTPIGSNVITIGSGFLNPIPPPATLYPGLSLPTMPSLTGEVLIADGQNDILNMGGTVSLAFLGVGNATVQGGSGNEFISTGSGSALLNLLQSGDVTVEAGTGPLSVNAATTISTVQDLIETGSSDATIDGGAGALTVLGGLGNVTLNGGSGPTYFATLPADAGNLMANLGTGNSTVLALSGASTISTMHGTTNEIYLGIGPSVIESGGNDNIFASSGAVTINALPGSESTLQSSNGWITYLDDTSTYTTNGVSRLSAMAQSSGVLVTNASQGTSIMGASSPVEVETVKGGDIISATGDLSVHGASLIDTVLGGAGSLAYTQGSLTPSAKVVGGSGTASVAFTGGADTFIGSSGEANVGTANAASATVTLGTGGGSANFSNVSNASIATSDGALSNIAVTATGLGLMMDRTTISAYGNNNINVDGFVTINAYSGSSNAISLSGAAQVNIGLGSAAGLSTSNVNVSNGTATVSISDLSRNDFTLMNSSLNFINTSILPQTVTGGANSQATVQGGIGGGVYIGGANGGNVLIGGTGVVTLCGGGNGDYLQANSSIGTNVLVSGTGSETLAASVSSGDNNFVINPGGQDDVVSQGSGLQTFALQANTGSSATLTGSSASSAFNMFNVETGAGHDGSTYLIRNFSLTNCAIGLGSFTGTGSADCNGGIVESNPGGTVGSEILLSNNTSIMLPGYVTAATAVSANPAGTLMFN